MKESKSDIILHPIRMRILQILINQRLSVQQMKERLNDIPQATLYRHLKKLLEAEVIHVVGEIPNRGTVEKIYSLHAGKANISLEELNSKSSEEHMTLFIKFIANLMAEYDRYLQQEHIDFVNDGVSFKQATLHLTDDEFKDLAHELGSAYSKVIHNKPEFGRKSRTFATIVIPEPKGE